MGRNVAGYGERAPRSRWALAHAERHALEASPHLSVGLPTGLGHARNAVVVLAASAVIAVGGGTGTLSEIALALKSGKRVIGLGTWEAHDARGAPAAIQAAASPQEAVDLALGTGLPGQDGGP